MQRRFLATFGLTSLAAPLLVFAAYINPGDLLLSAELQGKPMDIAYELHTHQDEMYVSAWIRGSVEGTDPMTSKTDARLTVDVAAMGGMARAKLLVRTLDGMGYIRLDSIEGTFADENIALSAEGFAKKWYAVSLEESGLSMSDMDRRELMRQIADSLFVMTRTASTKGATYSLKLSPVAADTIMTTIDDMLSQSTGDIPTDMGTMLLLNHAFSNANFHLKVETDKQEKPISLKLYIAVDEPDMHFVLQGISTLRKAPVSVQVPPDAVSLEEALGSWDIPFESDMPPADDMWTPDDTWEEIPSDNSSWSSSAATSSPCDGSSAESLAALRRGECGNTKPSRRDLQ